MRNEFRIFLYVLLLILSALSTYSAISPKGAAQDFSFNNTPTCDFSLSRERISGGLSNMARWLNQAEIENSMFARSCLDKNRVADIDALKKSCLMEKANESKKSKNRMDIFETKGTSKIQIQNRQKSNGRSSRC